MSKLTVLILGATSDKSKVKKYHYAKVMTPYEKLKSLDNAKDFLKESFSFEQLDKEAYILFANENLA